MLKPGGSRRRLCNLGYRALFEMHVRKSRGLRPPSLLCFGRLIVEAAGDDKAAASSIGYAVCARPKFGRCTDQKPSRFAKVRDGEPRAGRFRMGSQLASLGTRDARSNVDLRLFSVTAIGSKAAKSLNNDFSKKHAGPFDQHVS